MYPQDSGYKSEYEEYNDSAYDYSELRSEELLKHPEIVHSELFKNVPIWPEPGNNDLISTNI